MSFISKLLLKIGDFFSGLFNAAEKTWNKLDPTIQKAMINGSAVLEFINNNASSPAGAIISGIIKKYGPTTGITEEELLSGLKKVAEGLNIAEGINSDDLPTLVTNIANYLDKTESCVWAGLSSLGAKLFAFATAPAGTKWAIFESLMEFVYQHIIKKD